MSGKSSPLSSVSTNTLQTAPNTNLDPASKSPSKKTLHPSLNHQKSEKFKSLINRFEKPLTGPQQITGGKENPFTEQQISLEKTGSNERPSEGDDNNELFYDVQSYNNNAKIMEQTDEQQPDSINQPCELPKTVRSIDQDQHHLPEDATTQFQVKTPDEKQSLDPKSKEEENKDGTTIRDGPDDDSKKEKDSQKRQFQRQTALRPFTTNNAPTSISQAHEDQALENSFHEFSEATVKNSILLEHEKQTSMTRLSENLHQRFLHLEDLIIKPIKIELERLKEKVYTHSNYFLKVFEHYNSTTRNQKEIHEIYSSPFFNGTHLEGKVISLEQAVANLTNELTTLHHNFDHRIQQLQTSMVLVARNEIAIEMERVNTNFTKELGPLCAKLKKDIMDEILDSLEEAQLADALEESNHTSTNRQRHQPQERGCSKGESEKFRTGNDASSLEENTNKPQSGDSSTKTVYYTPQSSQKIAAPRMHASQSSIGTLPQTQDSGAAITRIHSNSLNSSNVLNRSGGAGYPSDSQPQRSSIEHMFVAYYEQQRPREGQQQTIDQGHGMNYNNKNVSPAMSGSDSGRNQGVGRITNTNLTQTPQKSKGNSGTQ